MGETMIRKQLESSEIQTGACHYCGQIYQFETDGRATEEQLDTWAVEKCDCVAAQVDRKDKAKIEKAKRNTEELFGEKYHEACEILKAGVDMIARYKAAKVTVDTGSGAKLSVGINAKGGIKAEITRTEKKSREI